MGQIVGIAIVWFIIEMLLWYLIAQFVSGWWVFMWFIIAAVIGLSLIRKGMVALNPMAQQMKAGGMMNPAMRPQESTMIKSVAMAVAGILLLIPGVISDLLALLVVLPPVKEAERHGQQLCHEQSAKNDGDDGQTDGWANGRTKPIRRCRRYGWSKPVWRCRWHGWSKPIWSATTKPIWRCLQAAHHR